MCDGRYDFHITGENPTRLADALHRAAALVTFNGTLFDLRFLRKAFGTLTFPRCMSISDILLGELALVADRRL